MSLPVLTETLSVAELRRVTPCPGRFDDASARGDREGEAPAPTDTDRIATFRDLDDPRRRVRLRGVPPAADGVFTLTLAPLRRQADGAPARAFGRCVHPWLVGLGGELLACWVGEPPVVGDAHPLAGTPASVIAWLTRFRDEAAQRRHAALLAASGCLASAEWRTHVSGEAAQWRLAPTSPPYPES